MKRALDPRVSQGIWLVDLLAVVFACFVDMNWAVFPLSLIVIGEWAWCICPIKKTEKTEKWNFKAPMRLKVLAALSVAYSMVNFFLCLFQLREGMPHIENGVYCLWDHGFIREISGAEYAELRIIEGRLFLGHLLAFSGLTQLFLSGQREKMPAS